MSAVIQANCGRILLKKQNYFYSSLIRQKVFRPKMTMKTPVHPGKIIRQSLETLDVTITDAAKWLGVPRQTLSRIINGKASVSPEMAVRISKAFGSTPEHWLRMQMAYDMSKIQGKIRSIHVKPFPAQV